MSWIVPCAQCASVAGEDATELGRRLVREPWLVTALGAVETSGLPDAWIGAGVIRDVVWGQLHDGFEPATVSDIDVAFMDPSDLSPHRDELAQQRLSEVADLPWEATNQAGVHTWFHHYFGGAPVPALTSIHEAVATWPETATCVAVRTLDGCLEVCAPHGLRDLLAGVWRRNPIRVTVAESQRRLVKHQVQRRWPSVQVLENWTVASGKPEK